MMEDEVSELRDSATAQNSYRRMYNKVGMTMVQIAQEREFLPPLWLRTWVLAWRKEEILVLKGWEWLSKMLSTQCRVSPSSRSRTMWRRGRWGEAFYVEEDDEGECNKETQEQGLPRRVKRLQGNLLRWDHVWVWQEGKQDEIVRLRFQVQVVPKFKT